MVDVWKTMPDCHTFVSYFRVFSQMSTPRVSANIWNLAVLLILTRSFSWWDSSSLVDEVQCMLISSRHICIRSIMFFWFMYAFYFVNTSFIPVKQSPAKWTREAKQVNASFRLAFNLRFPWAPQMYRLVMNCVGHTGWANWYVFHQPPSASQHKLIESNLL